MYGKLELLIMGLASVSGMHRRRTLLFFLTAAMVIIADQVTKSLVRANMTLGQSIPAEGRFRLSYTENSGAIFGLPLNSTFLTVLSCIVVIAIIGLYLSYLYKEGRLLRVASGLVMGGAIGNLIDRLRFGEVTDFADVQLWGDFHWAIFNIADASLTTGSILLVYCLLTMMKKLE